MFIVSYGHNLTRERTLKSLKANTREDLQDQSFLRSGRVSIFRAPAAEERPKEPEGFHLFTIEGN